MAFIAFLMVTGYDYETFIWGRVAKAHDFTRFYQSMGMTPLPGDVINATVFDNLVKLERERCDLVALNALGEALVKEGASRLAVQAYLEFPTACQRYGEGDRGAALLLFRLGDFKKARDLLSGLVGRFPQYETDWYHKGLAEAALGLRGEALESYATMIALTSDQSRLGEWVFTEMSRIYAESGKVCEAMTPIQTYVSIDPGRRNNARMDEIIAGYARRGNCAAYATGQDSFPANGHDVIMVHAMVNGVEGHFMVDTGASFVAVTQAFAKRANLKASGVGRALTANGEADVTLATATSIKLGRVQADEVPVTILSKPLGREDGLLGRSFLARFDMRIAHDRLTLSSK